MSTAVVWTPQRVDELTKLWAAGNTAAQIAGELGNVTRNAVIGKVHRLGLDGRVKAKNGLAPKRERPARVRLRRAAYDARRVTKVAAALAEIPESPASDSSAPTSFACRGVSLLELKDETCRWPMGDPAQPGFVFCGNQALAVSPYCAHHGRMAYAPGGETHR
ncbi:GcrA family cell cycle regulator [Bradyrhizobium sp. 31Argb]|uniref:GcrA family cell cycle regulator n=1 Tax=Bradyrhizobium sp. 31Argb TaxID=3141247 RepID=UPI003749F2E0